LNSNNHQKDLKNIPKHIAIIMDGNGRWAKSKKLPRIAGHREGVKTVRKITQFCGEIGVKTLTLFTFSSENWNRPKSEVDALMTLLVNSLKKEVDALNKNNVRFSTIGIISELSNKVQKEISHTEKLTQNNTGLNLNLALNYGGRQEIVDVVKKVSKSVKEGLIDINNIDEATIEQNLYSKNCPDLDVLIRTGAEARVSNFLLWQIAYSELFLSDVFWPSFSKNDLLTIIHDYQCRERRFGQTSEQIK
jgi:undecaprenyl diphosphate synthase